MVLLFQHDLGVRLLQYWVGSGALSVRGAASASARQSVHTLVAVAVLGVSAVEV